MKTAEKCMKTFLSLFVVWKTANAIETFHVKILNKRSSPATVHNWLIVIEHMQQT